MKRIASIILILAMIVSCLPMQVCADESEVLELPALEASVEPETAAASDDDLSWSLTNDGVLTVSGTGSMNSNIPWSAFSAQIRKVVLEEGVTTIANSAFYECYNLAEVILPDSLTTIGYSAFYKCTSLTSITIPVGVTKINSDVFWGCNSLEQIIVAMITLPIPAMTGVCCSIRTRLSFTWLPGHFPAATRFLTALWPSRKMRSRIAAL